MASKPKISRPRDSVPFSRIVTESPYNIFGKDVPAKLVNNWIDFYTKFVLVNGDRIIVYRNNIYRLTGYVGPMVNENLTVTKNRADDVING